MEGFVRSIWGDDVMKVASSVFGDELTPLLDRLESNDLLEVLAAAKIYDPSKKPSDSLIQKFLTRDRRLAGEGVNSAANRDKLLAALGKTLSAPSNPNPACDNPCSSGKKPLAVGTSKSKDRADPGPPPPKGSTPTGVPSGSSGEVLPVLESLVQSLTLMTKHMASIGASIDKFTESNGELTREVRSLGASLAALAESHSAKKNLDLGFAQPPPLRQGVSLSGSNASTFGQLAHGVSVLGGSSMSSQGMGYPTDGFGSGAVYSSHATVPTVDYKVPGDPVFYPALPTKK
ncbi:hypothetical protein 2 [Hubei orthoptera virus 5]|uniref:Uncharacterized protein n=1 Tax=Hubei orthoptera virus 5 TaxID=1923013 RepID=A0A1L3KNE4_9MONO|nr:hypothetical protein 2 [Hubei orthoptera virus 5]APG78859.1 hypothetical protein 2 [Hubei orthoptera virus 5]